MSVTETITTSLAGLVEETLKDPARPQGVAIDRAKMHALAQQIKTALETDPELQDSYYDITLRSILLKEQLAGDPSFAEAILNYALALSQKRGEEDPKPVIDAMIRVVNDVYNAQPGQGFVPDAEERKAYGSSLNRSTSYTLMIAATKFQQRSRNALEDPTNPPNKTR